MIESLVNDMTLLVVSGPFYLIGFMAASMFGHDAIALWGMFGLPLCMLILAILLKLSGMKLK